MTKIRTYKQFFKAIRMARRRGVVFCFYKSKQRIRSEESDVGWVRSRSVWSQGYANGSIVYYSPQQILHRIFFGGSTQKWICSNMAADVIGLSPDKVKEIELAQLELGGHNLALRRRLLKACGLKEVSHTRRILYAEKRFDDKRKCKA